MTAASFRDLSLAVLPGYARSGAPAARYFHSFSTAPRTAWTAPLLPSGQAGHPPRPATSGQPRQGRRAGERDAGDLPASARRAGAHRAAVPQRHLPRATGPRMAPTEQPPGRRHAGESPAGRRLREPGPGRTRPRSSPPGAGPPAVRRTLRLEY